MKKYTLQELREAIFILRDQYKNNAHMGGIENCPLCIMVGVTIDEEADEKCKCKYCINSAFSRDSNPHFSCVDRETFGEDKLSVKYWNKVLKFLEGKKEKDIFNFKGEIREKIKSELIEIDTKLFLKNEK